MGRASGRGGGRLALVALVGAVAAITAISCGQPVVPGASSGRAISPTAGLVNVTTPGVRPVSSIVWAVYQDVTSLDPIQAFDYPENTADALMCESLLRQAPDGSIQPGLATLADPVGTRLVFTLRPGVRFWDGHPVTAADVAYSLDRNTDPGLGGYYAAVFSRVTSIRASGSRRVTITLSQPDYWLPGELASMPGIVIEEAYAKRLGSAYGSPAGGIMCTGAYMLKSWIPGAGLAATINPRYWDRSVRPLAKEIVLKDTPEASLASGLRSGAISGAFSYGLADLRELKSSTAVRVYQGPAGMTEALAVSSLSGVLGDVRVRQALSLALDRRAIIRSTYHGAALMPRWLSNPGTFGYGVSVFDQAYAASPVMSRDLTLARALVKAARATGRVLTIGTSGQLPRIAAAVSYYQAAARDIGLRVALRSVPAERYPDFFSDPRARRGVDGFITVSYGDYADPAALLAMIVLPGGSQNYDGFSDPKIANLLNLARFTASPGQRAVLVSRAEQLTAQELPWIPDVQPTSLLLLNSSLTGAVASFSYMNAPWASGLGGAR